MAEGDEAKIKIMDKHFVPMLSYQQVA